MSLLRITNLGGGDSSLRLLPLFFRFFFHARIKQIEESRQKFAILSISFHRNEKNGHLRDICISN